MTVSLETQAARVDAAIVEYQQQRARLFDGTGKSIYAEHELQRRTDALLDQLRRTVQAFDETVDEHVALARQLIVMLRGDDPLDTLTNTELERVALLTPFVREEFQHERLPHLIDRMQAARLRGDKAAMLVWYRCAGQHFDALPDNQRRTEDAQDLRRVLQELRRALQPEDHAASIENAELAIKEAHAVQRQVHQRVAEVDGTIDRIRAEARARVAGAF